MLQSLPNVLVLTPVKDGVPHLDAHLSALGRLDWPRQKLALGYLAGDSIDGTFERLGELRPRFEERAARVTIVKRDFGFRIPAGLPRWTPAFQLARRAVLARARNHLLFAALADEEWVLWLDVDIIDFPPDILHRLLATGCDIVQPNCVLEPGGETFDRNAWSDGGRKTLHDFAGRPLVRLDSVGGAMLLVRADLHRDGLVFPSFKYGLRNAALRDPHPLWGLGEIETEGLAMMARDMGVQCWGVPDLEVFHARS